MTKNMTRKGLALGAVIALSVTGLSAVPANAAGNGLVGYVTLGADGGTYTNVLTTDTLDLKANFSPAVNEVSGRDLKFLVTDANSSSRVDLSQTNADSAATVALTAVEGTGTNTVTAAAAANLISGKTYRLFGVDGTADAESANGRVLTASSGTAAAVTQTVVNFSNADASINKGTLFAAEGLSTRANLNNALVPLGGSLEAAFSIAESIGGASTTAGRTAAGSYVVDSGIHVAGADAILRLSSNSATKQTHVVTAWIDTDGDGVIDSTEYASPEVTVNFLAPGDVTPTLTLDPIGINDLSLTARTTFSPALNMTQTGDVQTTFTRQGYAQALVADTDPNISTMTQVGTTDTYKSTINMFNLDSGSDTSPWAFTQGSVVTTTGAAKVGQVVTITKAAHGLTVGQIVEITAADAALNDAKFVVISAATGTFTIDVGTSTAIIDTTPSYQLLGEAAKAGSYSARVILDGILVGSAIFQTTGTTTIAALANTVSLATGVASDGTVRVGNTSAVTVSAKATKADEKAAAGVPVLVTVTSVSTAGTITVNGTKAAANGTFNLSTDASGEISLSVVNSSALVNEAITLQVKTQGQTATTTLTWTAAVYKLYDLNVLDGWQNGRTIEVGQSYNFDLALLDQWKETPTAGAYRVLVTTNTRTVSAGYVAMTSGRATFALTDGGLGTTMYSDVQMDIEFKSATATAFTTYAAGASDWDGSYSKGQVDGDDIVRVFVVTDQTDAIALDVEAGSLYDYNGGAVAADFVSPLSAKATIARNGQLSQIARPAYAEAATINGAVTNSISGVARASAVVTISGGSDLLFSVGETDAFGSLTTVADDDGFFTFNVYSTKTQTDTVVTMTTPDGASKTQKISFAVPAVTAVSTAVITGPANAMPGSTFTAVATLADVFGNGVDLDIDNNGAIDAGPTFVMTYTGPGVSFGSLPLFTDNNGQAKVQVLLGSNDTGTAVVTVTYDRDGTGVDYAPITATMSVVVGAAAASSDTKVNVGSFKGYVALYAKGYKGQKMTAIVAGKWIKVDSLASDFERVVRYTGAGYSITTKIYIDGVQIGDAFTTMTK